MKLYHFTGLFWLPEILREGITKGEIPISPHLRYSDLPKAPNLTRNPNYEAQQCWCHGGATDKTRVRLTVDLPDAEITSFLAIKKKYKISNRWIKRLAPNGEHVDWYFALNGVPRERICSVAIKDANGSYSPEEAPQSDSMEAVIADVIAERTNIPVVQLGGGIRCLQINADNCGSWLLDGVRPRAVDIEHLPFVLK